MSRTTGRRAVVVLSLLAAALPLYVLWCSGLRATGLHSAASSGDVARLKTMVGAVRPDARNSGGWTPLTLAVSNNHYEAARILLEAGASPNKKRGNWWIADGAPPLLLAATLDRKPIFDLLLQHGADVEARDWSKQTVLMKAANSGDVSMLRELLDRGASIRARDRSGKDALFWTCFTTEPEGRLVRNAAFLLERGAAADTLDRSGQSPLDSAAGNGWHEMVELLAKAGADVDREHPEGVWPLLRAARSGDVATMEVLLAHGAKPVHEGYDPADVIGMAATLEAADLLRRAIDGQLGVESR